MTIHGSKKGSSKQRQPVIAPDSAQSKTFISIMYGLGEGEIAGLANGYKSVYLDDTPLQNDDDEFNFPNVKVDFRTGTNDQEYIDGFADVASETNVGVELKHGTPWVKSFNNLDLDALRVRIKWGALRQQNPDNGDVLGVKIDYAIDVKTDNGGWAEALNTSINAKTSNAYERSHRIDLPKAQTGWAVRVRRITPNSTSELVSDTMYISAITEVIDLKLRYPNTALLGLRYDAEQFSNVAKMSAHCRGLIIKVPTNYNPITRTYDGLWDGQFKLAYCNNPAWVYYDLCTATRYGLGGRLTEYMIDKWSLYRLAQYCDQMVDDGMGGQEPRFTVNVYIQSADGAFELLSRLAGVFRAISYWDGTSIVLDADIPQDSIYSFSRANVIDGIFEYTGTRARDRHTVAKVAWDNPANHFKTEYEYVRDEKAIAKFGVRVADIQAWGCTSKGQAQRAGLWALKSEQLETRMVTFKVGLDGYIPAPAKVIEISDELFAGRATGGRVLGINDKKTIITLDRAITAKVGDTLVINGNDGTSQRRQISAVNGDNITVTKPFSDISEQNVWVLDSQDLATMKFRVLSVTADDNHQFTITAVQYSPAKYDAIDHGAYTPERPISVINPSVQAPTKSVNLSSYHTVNQGVTVTTLVIGWEQVTGAVKYAVEWRKDNGNWQTLPPTGTNSIEIAGVYAGQYEARVTAISAFGQASLATHSNLTQIQGKQGKPPRPINLSVQGVLFGMNLGWNFARGSDDTNYTEIQVSPDGRSNIATLGTFAYPTNKHEITGLQGNLTQFYRGRIVDKLGNTSDWTAWVSGTTSADADKVLDILSGQISQSHLDQSLRTPIGKIGTIESEISGINSKIPSIESNINSFNSKIPSINKIPTIESAINSVNSKIPTIESNINSVNSKIPAIESNISGINSRADTINSTLADANNRLNEAVQSITNIDTRTQWQTRGATSLNSLTEQGKYYLESVSNTNTPLTGWQYATVDKARNGDRITQTVWNDSTKSYTRTKTGDTWSAWVESVDKSQLDNTANQLTQSIEQTSTQIRATLATKASTDSVTSAIRDINALQADKNAKTAEIANLTQTVNGHTSQVRQLGVTTGDLTQKYSQLKTTSDTANSEITAIKQTQSGQATSVERLRSEMADKASSADLQSVQQTLTTQEQALSRRIGTV
ncbi:host specificity protein J, partial [Moraxella catarrhalis]|uniref:host specificity protein J n=1 Tax=Moraxella catarrhalis TaxID=480 RepID=UPI0007E845F9